MATLSVRPAFGAGVAFGRTDRWAWTAFYSDTVWGGWQIEKAEAVVPGQIPLWANACKKYTVSVRAQVFPGKACSGRDIADVDYKTYLNNDPLRLVWTGGRYWIQRH